MVAMRRWLLPVALGMLALPGFAETPAELLQRMGAAFVEHDYDGVFTFFGGEELASLRVVHKVVDGEQRERLVHLNGAPREILRHGEKVSCIVEPGDDIAVLEESIPSGPFARAFVRDFARIADTYGLETMGEGRVAGRMAVRLQVSPLDAHRYGFRLWLDEETALLLRSELIDGDGRVLEVFQFSQLTLGDEVSDEALEPQRHEGSMVSHLTLKSNDTASSPAAEPGRQWRLEWLPSGYRMAMADIRDRQEQSRVDTLMYTDGLATFSVFIEPMPKRGAANMYSQTGATIAMTRGFMAQDGAYYLATLVGEIPEATARRIIESIDGPAT